MSILNDNIVNITRRLDQVERDINVRFSCLEERVSDNEMRVTNSGEKIANHDEVMSLLVSRVAEINVNNGQQDTKGVERIRTCSIINKRLLSLERATDEKTRHLRIIDRKIVSLVNATNTSSMHVNVRSVPSNSIAMKDVVQMSRGENLWSL